MRTRGREGGLESRQFCVRTKWKPPNKKHLGEFICKASPPIEFSLEFSQVCGLDRRHSNAAPGFLAQSRILSMPARPDAGFLSLGSYAGNEALSCNSRPPLRAADGRSKEDGEVGSRDHSAANANTANAAAHHFRAKFLCESGAADCDDDDVGTVIAPSAKKSESNTNLAWRREGGGGQGDRHACSHRVAASAVDRQARGAAMTLLTEPRSGRLRGGGGRAFFHSIVLILRPPPRETTVRTNRRTEKQIGE